MPPRRTILVTGAGGFLGTELCAQLQTAFNVVGVDLPNVSPIAGAQWVILEDGRSLGQAVYDVRPDVLIHAAFRNRKPSDWTEDKYLEEADSISKSLYTAVTDVGADLLLVSSSAVYGNAGGKAVIDETSPKQPVSPYGRAKAAAEEMALSYARRSMSLCIVRLFNLVGPRIQVGTFMSDWVKQAIAFLRGETDAIYVRHRMTRRDFVDVRDASRALLMLASDFRSGEVFNVASESAVDLMEVSEELERLAGCRLPFVETVGTVEPVDVLSQCGSSEKLRFATGWRSLVPWQQSLADLWTTIAKSADAGSIPLPARS